MKNVEKTSQKGAFVAEPRKQDPIYMGLRVAEADFFIDSGLYNTYDGQIAISMAINSLYEEAGYQAAMSGRLEEFEAARRQRTQELKKRYAAS